MIIDPLNIFSDIKNEAIKKESDLDVYAFGSRVSGISSGGKWDFDVIISHELTDSKVEELARYLKDLFLSRVDENGKNVKVDIWTITKSQFSNFKKQFETHSPCLYAII